MEQFRLRTPHRRSRISVVTPFILSLLSLSVFGSASLAQLPTLPEPSTASLAPDSERYILDAGDQIYIEVFNVPDYSREYQVLTDGTISMPLIGAVSIRGITLAQAGELISDRYTRFIHTPAISVELMAARPMQIAIAGEVNRPGVYTIPPEIDPSTVTVTEVIQMAGGITQSANIRDVEVHSPYAQPQNAIKKADLWALLTTGDITQDLQLQDGDTIYLSTAAASVDPLETQTLASASFSADEIIVNVVGEVNSPGAIPVPPNTPLNQALLAAGGFNDDANRQSVELIRLNQNGTVAQQTIDIDFSQGVNGAANPPLRPNDTIVVKDSGLATFSRTIDSVLSPITGIFKLFRLFGF